MGEDRYGLLLFMVRWYGMVWSRMQMDTVSRVY